MFCKNCGTKIIENDIYCRSCGEVLKEKGEILVETEESPQITLPQNEETTINTFTTNNIKILFYALFLIALMVLNTFISYSLFDNSEKIESIKKASTKTVIEIVNKYKYNFMGYQLSIPNNYLFEEMDGILYISNEDDTLNIQVVIEKIPYWAIISDKDKLASMFVDEGYMVASRFKGIPYHNKAFLVGELNYNNSNIIVLYTQASETDSFQMIIKNDNNTYDYTKIEEITGIISNSSFNNKHIEKDLLIDFPRISKVQE